MLSSVPCTTSLRPPVQSLWIGAALSTMERLSIRSFLAQGHPFHLYVYAEVENVPAETTLLDARSILPESEIFVYAKGIGKGSYAAFSDLFRYKLLLERGGWWVDLDMVALRPFEFDRQHVFGYESAGRGLHVGGPLTRGKRPGAAVLRGGAPPPRRHRVGRDRAGDS